MGKIQPVSEFKEGECEWCGYEGLVFSDNSRCQDCDGDFINCSICKEEQHRDRLCRHVFRDQSFEWTGSGGYSPSNDVRESFLALLSAMPEGFSSDLKTAIQSGKFHTWRVSPLIGSGGSLSLYGMPKRDGRDMVNKWGEDIIRLGEADYETEKLSDGFLWLVSLFDRDTQKANRLTISWINQWEALP